MNDLGISDTRFRELRIALKPGRKHKVRFSYTPIKYTADQVPLQRTVVFNGRTYAVSVPVSSDVKWDFYRFGYEWDAISMRRGFIGLVTEVKYNKITASLDSAIVDAPSTLVTDGTLLKVYAWYDNEVGYVCRMVDLANIVARAGV